MLLKRIVGLPGETIAVKSGQLFINGASFREPWLPTTSKGWIHARETRTNPENYYLLGDNRNISLDSTEFGGIHRKLIRSKVFVILDADPFGIQIGKGSTGAMVPAKTSPWSRRNLDANPKPVAPRTGASRDAPLNAEQGFPARETPVSIFQRQDWNFSLQSH